MQRQLLYENCTFSDKIFFLPLQVCPSPEKPALQEQRYDPRVFLQSAFTSQTLTEALHSSESVNEYPNRLERQYTLIMKHNFKQIDVQILFYQVSHFLKKNQGVCVSNSFIEQALQEFLCLSFQ